MTTEKKTIINREFNRWTGQQLISNPLPTPGLTNHRRKVSTEKIRYAILLKGDHENGSTTTRPDTVPAGPVPGDAE